MKLVIVESPTKARTIQRFLDKLYEVKASYGHIRDLPKKKLGVDVKNNFKPEYVIPPKAREKIKELKKVSKDADLVILATDEDREGEAIAWHIAQVLQLGKFQIQNSKPKTNSKSKAQIPKPYARIVFHEITKKAISEALKKPRDISMNLVYAQQARRVLDRLVGYELSPFLWKKIRYGLSAGRVQSAAVRLIVEREEEIRKFKKEEYWKIKSKVKSQKSKVKGEEFEITLVKINNKVIPKLGIKTKDEAEKIKKELEKASYKVEKVTKKELKKNPLPPFTTSTLQQAANNRLGYSAKETMILAQQLYEGIKLESASPVGLITYMRTDSLNLSEESLKAAENYIKDKFGKEYSDKKVFKTKSKGAQEAHEAIRPTDPARTPESVKKYLDSRQYKIYQLIWQRMIASQMASAISDLTTIDVLAKGASNSSQGRDTDYILRASGSVIKFDGFLKVYPIKSEDVILPEVRKNENLDLIKVITEQHFTAPPARYTEASLVKKLEEEGIGRPSTYAPIISTIQDRGYVEKIERRFHPKEIGELVNKLLVKHFPKIVDFKFTAEVEKDLDKIADGKIKWISVVKEFYQPFKKNLMEKEKEINKKELTEEATDKICPKCGKPLVIKLGRFGKFYACSGYPECKYTSPIENSKEGDLKEKYKNEICEVCGAPMRVCRGKFGYFLGCSRYPQCRNVKNIENKTGVKCPKCGKGEIIEKKSKKGRIFYSCNRYPDCQFALWNKPTGEKCPKCGSLLVYAGKEKVRCSNRECGYKE